MHIFKNLISTFIFLTFFNCSDKSPVFQDNYLISNISVVDPVEGLKENIDILISGNRIQKISNYQSNKKLKIRVIDGTGKFIIPGLWDSHVHFSFNEKIAGSMSDLFLAHGVTSVRDTGGPLDIIMPHRDSADVKITDAPRVMIAGPSGDHAGSSHKAGFFDNFIGFPLSSDAPFIMDEIIKGDKAAKEVVAVVFLRNDLLVNF